VATSIRPLAQTVRLWVRDNLLTLGGSLLGVGLLAKLARSLNATRRADRERRQAPRAPRSSQEGERSGKRRLREQIQADPGSAAAALKQWMGNAA
jgi:flagellar biosynthesis/type III secretory pathway M-ring protein FliF/YscJ